MYYLSCILIYIGYDCCVIYTLYYHVYSILGINKRNLAYIKRLNPKKNIRLADNKSKTKNFLEQRWLPVPKTYKHITDRKELLNFDFGTIPNDTFVIKPNKWSKGKGIFILKRIPFYEEKQAPLYWWTPLVDLVKEYMYKDIPFYPYGYEYKGTVISDRELKKKLVAILEWNYTLANRPDTILIEEKILPWSGFEQFCSYGLADIRVIVSNLVPVAAMLRMPTKKSWWVANLAQWGIALGIDISSGQIRTLATDKKIYYGDFPEDYKDFYKFTVPFWEDILLYSSNIQYFVNMGYIGVDRVVTPDGPKLLEVNGKAWLEIQNITGVALQKVLDKIWDLDIPTPQKWVEIARNLFTPAKDNSIPSSKVLYLSQRWVLSFATEDGGSNDIDVVVLAKTNKMRNYTSLEIANDLKNAKHSHVKIWNTILKNIPLYWSDRIYGHRIELGAQTLKNYYIRPIHKSHANIKFINPKNILESEVDDLKILDRKLYEIDAHLPLSKILFPTNYLDQFDKFISHNGKYNPVFSYNFPSFKEITAWKTELQQLQDEHKGSRALKSKFAQLFYDKFEDIDNKIELIHAYKKQDFDKILLYNQKLFGEIDPNQVMISQSLMYNAAYDAIYKNSATINALEVRKIVHDVMKRYGIIKYKIELHSSMLSRISFRNGRVPTIKLNPNALRKQRELISQLEHEVGVHFQRAKNGSKTNRSILQRWCAYYIKDEEWLAI